MKELRFVQVILVIGLLMGTLCFSGTLRGADEVTLVVAVKNDQETLDWPMEMNNTLLPGRQMFEGLIFRDKDMNMVPALATSWEYIPDEQAWLVKLRKGVKFHNGEDFTAEDVKFTYERHLELRERSHQYVKGLKKVKEVKIIDDYTVKIICEVPYPLWPIDEAASPTIMPKDYFEEVGAEYFATHPVSAGPYKFVSWSRNNRMVLEAFDDYWGGRPEIDRVIFRVIPDEATQIAELLTGGVDVVQNVPMERASEVEANPNLEIVTAVSTVNQYLAMNTHHPPLNNMLVRRAISHAIDVDAIAQAIYGRFYRRATSIVQKTSFGFDPDVKPYAYDPEKARELLEEAGYPDGFETTLEVSEISLWPGMQLVAEAISGYLRDVGIDAKLIIGEWADFFSRFRAGELTGLFMWGNTAITLDADRHLALNVRSAPVGSQGFWWSNSTVDAAIDQAAQSADQDWRFELYSLVQRIVKFEAPFTPLIEHLIVLGANSEFDVPARSDSFLYVVEVKPRQ